MTVKAVSEDHEGVWEESPPEEAAISNSSRSDCRRIIKHSHSGSPNLTLCSSSLACTCVVCFIMNAASLSLQAREGQCPTAAATKDQLSNP